MAKSTATKSGAVSALDFLGQAKVELSTSVIAVHGDDAYLKGEVLRTLRRVVLEGEDGEFSLTTCTGKETQLREVLDALSTVSLFGAGRRLVIVEEADSFVTAYREDLEEYVARPATSGVLVLDVKTWTSNTRLAKAVATSGLAIECKAPNERQLKSWLTQHAKSEHGVRLDATAADALLALLPPELGIQAQELAKLSLLAGDAKVIDVKLVQENVGGWRVRAIWDMIDAAADGRAAEALAQLDRIIASGEKPHGLFPQMASSLRKFTAAMDLIATAEANRQKLPLRNALQQAGVLPFKLNDAERQLRQIGRARVQKLSDWLLAVDLAIKGHNSSDERARIELERLVVRLAKQSSDNRGGSQGSEERDARSAARRG